MRCLALNGNGGWVQEPKTKIWSNSHGFILTAHHRANLALIGEGYAVTVTKFTVWYNLRFFAPEGSTVHTDQREI